MFVPADPRTAAHLAVAIRTHRDTMARAGVHVPADLADLEETCTVWATKGQQGTFLADAATVVDAAAMKTLHTVDQVAAALEVHPRTVKRLLASGELPSVTVGAARRVHADDLHAYIDRHRQERP